MSRRRPVESRGDAFAERIETRIWREQAAADNPYLATAVRCHGYDLLQLLERRSFIDVFYLLFRGELPTAPQARLLERLMIGLINPGPRHPATRAVMNAAVSKAEPAHLLPIGLATLGGDHLGAAEVEAAMRFLRGHARKEPGTVAGERLAQARPGDGDWHPAPGFGSRFGAPDPLARALAERLAAEAGAGPALRWGCGFDQALDGAGMGWLATGVAAAALADLGFLPRAAAGLFQLLCAPGLLAHGIEMANKPLTAMPYVPDERYVIED